MVKVISSLDELKEREPTTLRDVAIVALVILVFCLSMGLIIQHGVMEDAAKTQTQIPVEEVLAECPCCLGEGKIGIHNKLSPKNWEHYKWKFDDSYGYIVKFVYKGDMEHLRLDVEMVPLGWKVEKIRATYDAGVIKKVDVAEHENSRGKVDGWVVYDRPTFDTTFYVYLHSEDQHNVTQHLKHMRLHLSKLEYIGPK